MIALVFATAKECAAALPALRDLPKPGCSAAATLHGRACRVLITGVGPVSAGIALGRMLGAHPDTRGVVNAGLGGSLDLAALPLGAPCAASAEIFPEYGLFTPNGLSPQGLGFAQWEGGDVYDRLPLSPHDAAAAMGLTLPQAWPLAPIVSVAGVSGTPERAATIQARYPDAKVENMEGFACALACAQVGVPFLELRTVSNAVGSRAAADWDIPGAFAALAAALETLLAPAGE